MGKINKAGKPEKIEKTGWQAKFLLTPQRVVW